MPGIHDAHTHLLAAAMQQLHEVQIGTDCTEQTLGPTLKDKCQCLQAHNTDDWLIANFYNGSLFPDGMHHTTQRMGLRLILEQERPTASTWTSCSLLVL